MKKFLYLAAACLLAACNGGDEPEQQPSLEVKPLQLDFAAADAAPQEITVTAVGVEWEYILSGGASEWVTVDDSREGVLTVSVADNPAQERRTASLAVNPQGNIKVKPRSVTIAQAGNDTPVVYSLTVEPAALTFEPENAPAQEVKVTTEGEGLTWSTEVEEVARGWITVTKRDGGFTVVVADNPGQAPRSGNITVVPDSEAASPKVVRVTQQELVLPPSLDIALNNGASPEEGFVLDYRGQTDGDYNILVTAVNVEWRVSVRYESGTDEGWINANAIDFDDDTRVSIVGGIENESLEPRVGWVVVSSDAEGVGPYEVKVTQEGKPDFISTLEEDVDFGQFTKSRIIVSPNDDWRHDEVTAWEIMCWDEGVEFIENPPFPEQPRFEGTGGRISFMLITEVLEKNDDNVYILPDGIYTVVANFDDNPDLKQPGNISAGVAGTYLHPIWPRYAWFVRMENGVYNGEACIRSGTMTVTNIGEDEYEIVFEFESDAGYRVEGSYKGTFDIRVG